jgi:hypothetical protein
MEIKKRPVDANFREADSPHCSVCKWFKRSDEYEFCKHPGNCIGDDNKFVAPHSGNVCDMFEQKEEIKRKELGEC